MKNVFLAIAFFVMTACGGSHDSSTDISLNAQAVIDSGHHAFLQAMRSNDADALALLVSPDAKFMPPNDAIQAGREGVRDWFKGIISQFKTKDVSVTDRDVIVTGDYGIEQANFLWTLTPVAGGTEIVNKGKFVAIWQKDSDSTWRIKTNIWNSSIPPPQ